MFDHDRFARFVLAVRAPGFSEVEGVRGHTSAGWGSVLEALYAQPHRHYHTIGHINAMLNRFDVIKARPIVLGQMETLACETAIWFHDAVYVPGSKDNEIESARLAVAFLASLEVPEPFRRRVSAAILATTHRQSLLGKEWDLVAATLLDLDLFSLAAPWEDFRRNNANIRKESTHITDEQFRWGQVAFLAGLMQRPAIFYVEDRGVESQARLNIETYLAELVAGRF